MYSYLDDSKEYEKAIPVCKDIVARDIDSDSVVAALVVMAECMHPLGRDREAIDFADEYCRQHSGRQIEADYARVQMAYWGEKDWTKVASLCEKFIKDYPDNPAVEEMRDHLGDALVSSGQSAKARLLYYQLSELDSAHAAKWQYKMAYIDYAEGNWASACDAFKAVSEKYPNSAWDSKIKYFLADSYYHNGDKVHARELFEQVATSYSNTDEGKSASNYLKYLESNN